MGFELTALEVIDIDRIGSPGVDPGFRVRGAHLIKLRRAEGCAKMFVVFRVKNHDFTPKIIFFPILGWRATGAPLGSAPVVIILAKISITMLHGYPGR